jgi:hypothetical protein
MIPGPTGQFLFSGVGLEDTYCTLVGLSEFESGVEYEDTLHDDGYKWIQSIFSDIGARESVVLGSKGHLLGEKRLQNYFEEGYRPGHN